MTVLLSSHKSSEDFWEATQLHTVQGSCICKIMWSCDLTNPSHQTSSYALVTEPQRINQSADFEEQLAATGVV